MEELRKLNRKLVPKGLRILPLRYSSERVLIYLYRPKSLERDLAQEEAAELLEKAGTAIKAPTSVWLNLYTGSMIWRRSSPMRSGFP